MPIVLSPLLNGQVGSIRITPEFLFGAAVVVETARCSWTVHRPRTGDPSSRASLDGTLIVV
jgi:hypothetical protein